ncbi:hypothetical protein B5P41_28615 [Bacillus sp. SRB_28]|nr:hypothetical protein B5P41_28615 [Bacillus sp. SRB_28]
MKQKECPNCYSMQEANFPAIVSHPQVNQLVTDILYLLLLLLLFRFSSFHIKWTDSLPMFKIDYVF